LCGFSDVVVSRTSRYIYRISLKDGFINPGKKLMLFAISIDFNWLVFVVVKSAAGKSSDTKSMASAATANDYKDTQQRQHARVISSSPHLLKLS
jgi:hypothetical protein